MESQSPTMSATMSRLSRLVRCSGIPCQKCSRKFWTYTYTYTICITKTTFINVGNVELKMLFFFWVLIFFLSIYIHTSSKFALITVSSIRWQCVRYIMMNVCIFKWMKYVWKQIGYHGIQQKRQKNGENSPCSTQVRRQNILNHYLDTLNITMFLKDGWIDTFKQIMSLIYIWKYMLSIC